MEQILKYYPELTEDQRDKFSKLYDLYTDWNSKINVISRKDIENLYEHHVLHSLAITEMVRFTKGSTILDVGTGGGFPGIPLAIFYPECKFVLIDSIGKKVKVAAEVAKAIGLNNIELLHERVQDEKRLFDFVVSRAVMPLADLVGLVKKNVVKKQQNAIPNGLICLKGGELAHEILPFKKIADVQEIKYKEEYFKTKRVVFVPL